MDSSRNRHFNVNLWSLYIPARLSIPAHTYMLMPQIHTYPQIMKPQNLGEHIKTHPGSLFPLNAGCYIVWIPGRNACPVRTFLNFHWWCVKLKSMRHSRLRRSINGSYSEWGSGFTSAPPQPLLSHICSVSYVYTLERWADAFFTEKPRGQEVWMLLPSNKIQPESFKTWCHLSVPSGHTLKTSEDMWPNDHRLKQRRHPEGGWLILEGVFL